MIPERYTKTAIALHWLIAMMILINLALPTIWENFAPDDMVRPIINLHKSFGITLIGLVILRFLWRFTHRPPSFPAHFPSWERWLAHITHIALYAFMLGVPLLGWFMDSAWKDAAANPIRLYGAIPFPRVGWIMDLAPASKEAAHAFFGQAHTVSGYALLALVVLHVAGALKHQFIDHEPELQRMFPSRNDV